MKKKVIKGTMRGCMQSQGHGRGQGRGRGGAAGAQLGRHSAQVRVALPGEGHPLAQTRRVGRRVMIMDAGSGSDEEGEGIALV